MRYKQAEARRTDAIQIRAKGTRIGMDNTSMRMYAASVHIAAHVRRPPKNRPPQDDPHAIYAIISSIRTQPW